MDPDGFEKTLLGFDAREMRPSGLRAPGPSVRRLTQFLLRTDLEDVLSADTMIWPSIFGAGEVPEPEWVGLNAPFWGDLSVLRKAIARGEADRRPPFWLIAAMWHTDLGFEKEAKQEGKFAGPYVSSTTPEHPEASWRFLGFDITDGGFVSGLSNCGYDAAERDGLAAEWARDLNRNHLFDDLQRAFKFRALTNARVPEHAPFFVIGLWLIAKGFVEHP